MTRERKVGLALGVSALLLVAAALAAVAWRESKSLYYTVVFKNERGLQAGDHVVLQDGTLMGVVRWVMLNTDPNRIHVRVKIAPHFADRILLNSTAWVRDVAGRQRLEIINPGTMPPPPPLPVDAIVLGVEGPAALSAWERSVAGPPAPDPLVRSIGALEENLKEIGTALPSLWTPPELCAPCTQLLDFMQAMREQGRRAAGPLGQDWPKVRDGLKPLFIHLQAIGRVCLLNELQATQHQIEFTLDSWRQAT